VGLPYSEQLSAAPGNPADYTWSLGSEAIPGITLAPNGLLSGVPSAGGKLTVIAQSASGLKAQAELDLRARQSCWLAYLEAGSATDLARLHIRDVFARYSDITLPAGAEGGSVLDFEFSPDGRWLAFRVGALDQAVLHVLELPAELGPSEPPSASQPVDLRCGATGVACPVLGFAWSKDSKHLALVLHHPQEGRDYLEAVDPASPGSAGASVGVDQTLGMALTYTGGLTWFGDQRVALLGENPLSAQEQVLYHAQLNVADGSFSSLALMLTVAGKSLTLRDSAPGLVVLDPESDTRYIDVENNAVRYHAGAWLSPSARFFAKTTDAAQLELYAPSDPDTPIATLDDAQCGAVVAWSAEHDLRESIACSAAARDADGALEPTGADLTLLDLIVEPEPRFSNPFRVLENAVYTAGPIAGVRRLFSDSASWLIMAAPAYDALIIDRSQPSPRAGFLGISISGTSEAEISPDGSFVLVYDDVVTAYPLAHEAARGLSWLADGSKISTPVDRFTCQESTQLLPERWCGEPRLPAHFRWASDSQSVMFEDAEGGLWIAETTPPADPNALDEAQPRRLSARLPRPPAGLQSRAYAYRPGANED
jgi:hypothetical protein